MDILIYGYGKMASAMVEGWLRAGLDPRSITVYNPRPKDVPPGVTFTNAIPDRRFDRVLLGFKPQMLRDIAPEMQGLADDGSLIISILAGIDLDTLSHAYPNAGGWLRFMPNLAVALGKSPNLLTGKGLTDGQRDDATRLAEMLGSAHWLADQSSFDLASALAGSGPAFLFRFIDALAAAGGALGLDQRLSDALALEMVDGAAALAAGSTFSPGELADRVASPGGMTREGMNVLDQGKALENLLISTLDAAAARGSELARMARGQG